ncbi:MAG: DedA family protein [Rhizobiaceae bacterium]|nr:DedA family protein [Rhizobiaceae bacterium]
MLDSLMSFLAEHGVWVVFVGIFLESSGLPFPGESLLIAAGVLAGQNRLDIFGVFLAAWTAGVLGDNVGYAIGYRYGRPFVYRYGARVGLARSKVARIEKRLLERGPPIVLIARFVLILRQLCGFLAGTAHMPWWQFSFYNALGAALWAGVYTGGAFVLGAAVERYLSAGTWVFAAVAIVFVVASGMTVYGFVREGNAEDDEEGERPA